MTEQLILGGLEAWLPSTDRSLQAKESRESRQRLLAALANSILGTMEQRVAQVLRDCPETRDSDVALMIRYWRRFQAEVIAGSRVGSDLEILFELDRPESLTRARRHIQNDLHLFQATPHTQNLRNERQRDFRDYLLSRQEASGELHFYLDETGNSPEDRYTGVGGVCVLDVRAFEMSHAALTNWRDAQGWPETLHFKDIREASRHLELLEVLRRHRAGLLFLGHSAPARGDKREMLFTLTSQMVVDALRHAVGLGCLNEPRGVTVFKESDEGFDKFFLSELHDNLAAQLAQEFPGRAFLRQIQPLPKGREVMLEVADTIASSMRRRSLHGSRQPKDIVAEAAMNVAGFEDARDNTAVFKAY